ncbi:MAG: hypothetical protein RL172_420 [Bacteroidota bacterium]
MFYLVRTPWWLKKIYAGCTWHLPGAGKIIYLSFDDGPHPVATPFVLEQLKKYNAKASFFCIGKNVTEYPFIYEQVLDEGHSVGNHTYHHLNGWKTENNAYIDDIMEAKKIIDSTLFRPPYGRATRFQLKIISRQLGLQPIMWSVLSGDFDEQLSPEKCAEQVILKTRQGDIVVFHDSAKAFNRLSYALPLVLDYFTKKGYSFKAIPQQKR